MKNKFVKAMSFMMMWALLVHPLWACTAAPKADVSRPVPPSRMEQMWVVGEAAVTAENGEKERSADPFVIDNFKVIQATLAKLGISNEELEQLIKEGKKLPEVLEVKEIKVERFKKALVKEYWKAIDEGVTNKQLTKEEGKMLKSAIKEKVMSWLTTK